MFIINKNTANNSLTFTGYEKGVLVNPYYLFEFTKDDTSTSFYVIGTDISTYQERFNECLITETTTPNTLIGEIELVTGMYKYSIYEQASSTNLNPTGLTEVETGYLRVRDLSIVNNIEYTGSTLTDTVYNG